MAREWRRMRCAIRQTRHHTRRCAISTKTTAWHTLPGNSAATLPPLGAGNIKGHPLRWPYVIEFVDGARVGLEPTRIATADFESAASTDFATRAAARDYTNGAWPCKVFFLPHRCLLIYSTPCRCQASYIECPHHINGIIIMAKRKTLPLQPAPGIRPPVCCAVSAPCSMTIWW